MGDVAVAVTQVLIASLLQFHRSMTGLSLLGQLSDFAWMDPVEQDHNEKHQSGVEDVQVSLVTEQVSSVALDILDDSEYASY